VAAAAHAYRLSAGKDQTLSKFVGRTIRIDGTLTQRSDLIANNAAAGAAVGTSGGRRINEDDLAKVDVASVTKVANGCGRSSAHTRRPR
jgi:hypothetical protein